MELPGAANEEAAYCLIGPFDSLESKEKGCLLKFLWLRKTWAISSFKFWLLLSKYAATWKMFEHLSSSLRPQRGLAQFFCLAFRSGFAPPEAFSFLL